MQGWKFIIHPKFIKMIFKKFSTNLMVGTYIKQTIFCFIYIYIYIYHFTYELIIN